MRRIGFPFLVLTLLSFLLPFVEISCRDRRLVTMSGAQLLTGGKLDVPRALAEDLSKNQTLSRTGRAGALSGPGRTGLALDRAPRDRHVIAAFACGVLAALFALVGTRITRGLSGLFSVVAVAALFLLKADVDKADANAALETLGFASVRCGQGFWAAVALFAAAVVLQMISASRADPDVD